MSFLDYGPALSPERMGMNTRKLLSEAKALIATIQSNTAHQEQRELLFPGISAVNSAALRGSRPPAGILKETRH